MGKRDYRYYVSHLEYETLLEQLPQGQSEDILMRTQMPETYFILHNQQTAYCCHIFVNAACFCQCCIFFANATYVSPMLHVFARLYMIMHDYV